MTNTETTILRPAERNDAAAIAGILAAGRAQTYGLNESGRAYDDLVTWQQSKEGIWDIENYLNELECEGEQNGRAQVAVGSTSNEVLGVMTSQARRIHGLDAINLDYIFVKPEAQGKGIGRALMTDFDEWAGPRWQEIATTAKIQLELR